MLNLDRQGVTELNQRHTNVIIRAADMVVEELSKDHRPAEPGMGLKAWLQCDDTGLSSRYMARVLCKFGVIGNAVHYPHDPADFGRCVGLLDAEPRLRESISALTENHGPQWKVLIEHWDELEVLYRTGKAPRLSERMKQLLG